MIVSAKDWWTVLNTIVREHGGYFEKKYRRGKLSFVEDDIQTLLHELGHIACLPAPESLRGHREALDAVLSNLPKKDNHDNEVFAEVIAARVCAGFKIPVTYYITPGVNDFTTAQHRRETKRAVGLAAMPFSCLPAALRRAQVWAWNQVLHEVHRLPIHNKTKAKIPWLEMEDRLRQQQKSMDADPLFRLDRSSFWKNSMVSERK